MVLRERFFVLIFSHYQILINSRDQFKVMLNARHRTDEESSNISQNQGEKQPYRLQFGEVNNKLSDWEEKILQNIVQSILEESHIHSPTSFLEEISKAEERYLRSQNMQKSIVAATFKTLRLRDIFLALWRGLQCPQCAQLNKKYYTSHYYLIQRLIFWVKNDQLSVLQDYVAFYSLNDCLLQQLNISASQRDLLWQTSIQKLEEQQISVSKSQFPLSQHLSSVFQKYSEQLKEKIDKQLKYFKLAFNFAILKFVSNDSQQNYQIELPDITKTSFAEVELITKFFHFSHLRLQLPDSFVQKFAIRLKKRIENELFVSTTNKSKLLWMLEHSPQPHECMCFIHHSFKLDQKHSVGLRLPRTESKVIQIEESAHSLSGVLESELITSSAYQQVLFKKSMESSKLVNSSQILNQKLLASNVIVESNSVQRPKSLLNFKIINFTDKPEQQNRLLQELQSSSLTDPQLVNTLFENYLTLFEKDKFIVKIQQQYRKSNQQSRSEWGRIRLTLQNNYGHLIKKMIFQ